jgi:hypothetical protein
MISPFMRFVGKRCVVGGRVGSSWSRSWGNFAAGNRLRVCILRSLMHQVILSSKLIFCDNMDGSSLYIR